MLFTSYGVVYSKNHYEFIFYGAHFYYTCIRVSESRSMPIARAEEAAMLHNVKRVPRLSDSQQAWTHMLRLIDTSSLLCL